MKSIKQCFEDAAAADSGYGSQTPDAMSGAGPVTYPDVAHDASDIFDINYQKGSGDVVPFRKRKKPYEAKPATNNNP